MEANDLLLRNWDILERLLPEGWAALARTTGAVRRLRGFSSEAALLRVLLIHAGPGLSLREAAAQARLEELADVSDVAIMHRLRQCEPWLRALCQALLRQSADPATAETRAVPLPGLQLRAVDATTIHEPGPTGSLWRLHYSLTLPELRCDQFTLTPSSGSGNGESFKRYQVKPGEVLCADRGLSGAAGIAHVVKAGGHVLVRAHPQTLGLRTPEGELFPLRRRLTQLREPGRIACWPVAVQGPQGLIAGRLCALRKSETQSRREARRLRRKAQRKQRRLSGDSTRLAQYVLVFTTLESSRLSPAQVLELYRWRWQIELHFKRLKSLARLGHLPKHDPGSSRAWLYAKLLIALLADKLARHGRDFSPWGYPLPVAGGQSVA